MNAHEHMVSYRMLTYMHIHTTYCTFIVTIPYGNYECTVCIYIYGIVTMNVHEHMVSCMYIQCMYIHTLYMNVHVCSTYVYTYMNVHVCSMYVYTYIVYECTCM